MKLFRYILFVIAVVSLQSGLAQRSDYQPEFTVGVKGGTTLSRVSFTPTVTQSLLLGYTGGVSVRYIEEKFFGLIAEINFTQCGWNETFEEDPYTYTHTLNYVTIPFLTHFFFGNRVVRGFVMRDLKSDFYWGIVIKAILTFIICLSSAKKVR